MKVEVRYYTKTGNTEKIAQAIAKEDGVEARTLSEPITYLLKSKVLQA